MPRIIQTTASGSPLPDYLTQSPRQKVINITQRNQLQTLPSGIRYAYSGEFGSGPESALSVTLLDIADSGDADLLMKLSFSINHDTVTGGHYTGFDLAINGVTVMFTRDEQGSSTYQNATEPTIYEFILPAHSSFIVLGLSETTTAVRIASVIGRPL